MHALQNFNGIATPVLLALLLQLLLRQRFLLGLAVLGSVVIFHFKFIRSGHIFSRRTRCKWRDAFPSILAPPGRLAEDLIGERHQFLFLFSNEGERFPFLPALVVLPLHLAKIHPLFLNKLRQVLHLVVAATGRININFQIAHLPFLFVHALNRRTVLRRPPLPAVSRVEHTAHVRAQLVLEHLQSLEPKLRGEYS